MTHVSFVSGVPVSELGLFPNLAILHIPGAANPPWCVTSVTHAYLHLLNLSHELTLFYLVSIPALQKLR